MTDYTAPPQTLAALLRECRGEHGEPHDVSRVSLAEASILIVAGQLPYMAGLGMEVRMLNDLLAITPRRSCASSASPRAWLSSHFRKNSPHAFRVARCPTLETCSLKTFSAPAVRKSRSCVPRDSKVVRSATRRLAGLFGRGRR